MKIRKKIEKYFNIDFPIKATKKTEKYLENLVNKGELIEFKVVCDNTNNNTDDLKFTHIDVYLKPISTLKYIAFNITVDSMSYRMKKIIELREKRKEKLNKIYDIR